MKITKQIFTIVFLILTGHIFGQTLTAEIEHKEGLYIIYPGQKPIFEYEYIETIDAGNFIRNYCS